VKKGNKKPSRHSKDDDEKRAGDWQQNQRQAYKNKTMSDERIELLNNTPGWTWDEEDTYQEQWDHWKDQYVKKGNKKPSDHSKDPDEKRAGQWQSKQRQAYKKKTLSEERIELLNDTPGWTWEGKK